jgi:hypothetical protein
VRKFFSHRSTYVSPICSKMISHCISSYPACSLARLESNSGASVYAGRRSTLFLIQRSFKSSNGQQSISTAQNLTRGPDADAKYGVGRLLYSCCIHCRLRQVVRECSWPGTVNPDRSDWLYVDQDLQMRTPNTALVAAQQLDFDRSHSATSHNPCRYSRYIRVPRHSSGV